jgi:cobyrinic acid a,c-diamide synthase
MVTAACPSVVIAGTGSGVGKTSLALGLVAQWRRRGLRVQTFKVGPDFLDPSYLVAASGRNCYNLDGWMTSRGYVRQLFARATADADVAVVEGVMGMFDGASPTTLEGSTAEIAQWLDAPVLLVVPSHGVARSLAATVKGFVEFVPDLRFAGVIANQSGSERHRSWLTESLAAAGLPPLVGAVPRDALPPLASRHLGLVTADVENLSPQVLEQLADACRKHVDLDLLLERIAEAGGGDTPFVPQGVPPTEEQGRAGESGAGQGGVRAVRHIGIAQDAAFHFYYADNLESLSRAGVEWTPFSPLADADLPAGLDGLYFGGGYPELYAERLAENRPMLAAVRALAASGRAVYAECGGLMYLGRTLTGLDGRRWPMAGVLPLDTVMLDQRKALGYSEVTLAVDSLWGAAGAVCRGHEFHYSDIVAEDGTSNGWQRAYTVWRRRVGKVGEGFAKGNILAGYVHLHWASRPEIVDHLLSHLGARG